MKSTLWGEPVCRCQHRLRPARRCPAGREEGSRTACGCARSGRGPEQAPPRRRRSRLVLGPGSSRRTTPRIGRKSRLAKPRSRFHARARRTLDAPLGSSATPMDQGRAQSRESRNCASAPTKTNASLLAAVAVRSEICYEHRPPPLVPGNEPAPRLDRSSVPSDGGESPADRHPRTPRGRPGSSPHRASPRRDRHAGSHGARGSPPERFPRPPPHPADRRSPAQPRPSRLTSGSVRG